MQILNVINSVVESFNSPASISWTASTTELTGMFKVAEHDYEIRIKEFDLADVLGTADYVAAELSFVALDADGDYSFSTKLDSSFKQAMSVFSTVNHGALEKFKSEKYNMMYFIAKKTDDSYEKRNSLYKRLSDSIAKKENLILSTREISQGTVYILQHNTGTKISFDKIIDKIL